MEEFLKHELFIDVLKKYSKESDDMYDDLGVFKLFKACVTNLTENQEKIDWKKTASLLNQDQLEFIKVLIRNFEQENIA